MRLAFFLCLAITALSTFGQTPPVVDRFERIATFDVAGEVAEIVAATPDGRTLVYTNSEDENVGFVDLSTAAAPRQMATVPVGGEPTSVAVTTDGRWALVAVHGSPDSLTIIDIATRAQVRSIELGGQPDSIAVSPDGRHAAVAIENERDEDLNDGVMPQGPAGFLVIVDLAGAPSQWSTRRVDLTGIASRFGDDPEPEFVDINSNNVAAVTLQENNHIALVDLVAGRVTSHFSAGQTSHLADTVRDGDIVLDDMLVNARREPDAIGWTPGGQLAIANEGDYDIGLASGEHVGGRDFTILTTSGQLVFEPGTGFESEAVRHGHYPESRSAKKGSEPEGLEAGVYGSRPFLFVASERGDFVAVYRIDNESSPVFVQLLPTGDEPEGLVAIPSRNLFVSANEGDGTLSIFEGRPGSKPASYPTVVSDGIAWGALSGLSPASGNAVYAVPDDALAPSRIFTIEPGHPSRIVNVLRLAKNYDLEGIATIQGGWWVVSEGKKKAGESGVKKNLLVRINSDGTIAEEIELPAAVNAQQVQFGFEGVTTSEDGSQVYVVFQREWTGDPAGRVRIGRYTPSSREWRFYHYPLDAAPEGGWVGLSEIARIDDQTFAVIERDNQQRDDARVKRIYRFSITGLEPAIAGATPPLVTKNLMRDLLAEDGWKLEKAEGLTFVPAGMVVVSDNDGAGETRLVRFNRARRIWH